MAGSEVGGAWVVYRMTLYGGTAGGNAVCQQHEWDALEAARPGFHTLLHAGLATEQEAERLARGAAGEGPPRAGKQKRKHTEPGAPAPPT
jgi:hypothetical protein